MKIVYLTDENKNYDSAYKHFKEAGAWAKENCKSFISYDIQDVGDVSYVYDQVAEYKFNDVKDAIWFELRWR